MRIIKVSPFSFCNLIIDNQFEFSPSYCLNLAVFGKAILTLYTVIVDSFKRGLAVCKI